MKSSISQHHGWILADGHVHIHDRFSDYSCFDWAQRNFRKTAAHLNLSGRIDHVLFLTESSSDHWFQNHRKIAAGNTHDRGTPYHLVPTREENSLCLEDDSTNRLYIIAGRQIISSERLEVLALGLCEDYPDGQPLRRIFSDIRRKDGCITVLPWGVGKWLGARKHSLVSLLVDMHYERLFLGDNGNRPFFWPLPAFFEPSGQHALGNLPGSDPLPLAGQEKRVGSYGFLLEGTLDQQSPFHDLTQKIGERPRNIRTFGKPERMLPFLFNQIAMRLLRFKKL